MTLAEINNIADLFAKAGTRIPVIPAEWREMQIALMEQKMATKSVGKVSKKELEKGKIKPVVKQSVPRKIAAKKKADRTVTRLQANVASSKANRERAKK